MEYSPDQVGIINGKEMKESSSFNELTRELSTLSRRVLKSLGISDMRSLLELSRMDILRTGCHDEDIIAEIDNLRKEIVCKYQVSFDSNLKHLKESLYSIIVSRIGIRIHNTLLVNKIKSLDSLMKLELETILEKDGLGPATAEIILREKELFQTLYERICELIEKNSKTQEIFDPEMVWKLLFNTVEEVIGPIPKLILSKSNVNNIHGFMTFSEEHTNQEYKEYHKSIRKIISTQFLFRELFTLFHRIINTTTISCDLNKFADLTNTISKPDNSIPNLKSTFTQIFSIMKDRDQNIIKLYLGWNDAVPMSLAAIGRKEGITRERVRQLVKRAVNKIFEKVDWSNLSQSFIDQILSNRKEPLMTNDYAQEIPSFAGFESSPTSLVRILSHIFDIELFIVNSRHFQFFSGITQDEYNKIFDKLLKLIQIDVKEHYNDFFNRARIQDYLHEKELGYLESVVITDIYDHVKLARLIKKVAQECANETIDNNLWSIDINLLADRICSFEEEYREHKNKLIMQDISNSLRLMHEPYKIHQARMYSADLYNLKFGYMPEVLNCVLKHMQSPKHHTEISKAVQKWRPEFSPRTLYITLSTRVDTAILWDRGIFIHLDNIDMPYSLIHDVEVWILEKLSEDVPYISINGAYNKYKYRCSRADIVSATGLYSCLKISNNAELEFPWLPNVFLKSKYDENISMIVAFEEYLRDAGGPVSRQELENYWLEKVFLTIDQLNQLIPRTINTIRLPDSNYIHIDNIDIDREKLNSVIKFTKNILEKENHYSIKKIYEEKKITCKLAGVDGPLVLFQILEHYLDDNYTLSIYPRIEHEKQKDNENRRSSILKRVADFIYSKSQPCSYQLISKEFLERYGYNDGHIYHVTTLPDVVRYHKRCLVHLDTLEWNSEKQSILEKVATELYSDSFKARAYFARISHLIESNRLPILPSGIYWSNILVAELLRESNRFHIIGNSLEAYVLRNNQRGIHNLESLVAEMLKLDWNGAANHKEFETKLVKMGIVRKSLTSNMLSTEKSVTIKDGVILLKGIT